MATISIIRVENPAEKAEISAHILHALPDWFGLPDSTQKYIDDSRNMPFFRRRAGRAGSRIRGAEGNQPPARGKFTSWAYCRNITEAASGSGCLRRFGRRQSREVIGCCRLKPCRRGHYEEYDRTNAFYQRMGFLPLECLPTLWDEWNPCQVYVLPLQNS